VAYEELVGGAIVGAGFTLIGAGLKLWKDASKQETEQQATKKLAETTAKALQAHQDDCNKKNIMIARLDERVTTIQVSQSEIRKTVDRMDEKLDHLLEKS
jgi:RNase H-fold protein (predicted Holliday junction resolvase)